jgi:hypothetical protein
MTHSGSRGSPHHENIVARSVTPQRAMRLPGMRMVDRGLAASAMTLILAACTSTSPTGPARTPAPPPGTLVAPSAAEASTVTPSARPTRTTTPTPRADGWRPVPDQTTVQGIQFLHVIWTGRRFVATGLEFDAGGVFLDSSDGITWHLQAGAYPEAGPGHLAVGSRGLVAVSLGAYRASWFSTEASRGRPEPTRSRSHRSGRIRSRSPTSSRRETAGWPSAARIRRASSTAVSHRSGRSSGRRAMGCTGPESPTSPRFAMAR